MMYWTNPSKVTLSVVALAFLIPAQALAPSRNRVKTVLLLIKTLFSYAAANLEMIMELYQRTLTYAFVIN